MRVQTSGTNGMRLKGEYTVRLPDRHPGQKKVVSEAKRFNVMSCGRRWGKTTLGLDLLTVHPGGAVDGLPVAWFAPNGKLFAEVWLQAIDLLHPIATRIDGQQNRIDLITGGHIDFWTLHNTDNAGRGRKYARVFIDEAAMLPSHRLEPLWTASIRPTLTDMKGEAWFGSTPTGMNYFWELWARGQSEEYPDWMSWQLPTITNPYIDPAEVDEAAKDIPRLVYEQEYLAWFVDFSGARVQREWLQQAPPPTRFDEVVMGVDLAISTKDDADFTACVVCGKHDGNFWILAAERRRAGFHAVIDFVKAMAATYNPHRIIIETVQYQAAVVQELLKATNLPVFEARPDRDKLTRFLPLEARYEQRLVWHAPGLELYEQELLAFPNGQHDDLVDAAAYAYNALGYTRAAPRVRSL